MVNKSSTDSSPAWDLSNLYAGTNDPKITNDLEYALKKSQEFNNLYSGKVRELDALEFANTLCEYESLSELLSKILSFAQLMFAANADDPQITMFYQNINEKVNSITVSTIFFELEINELTNKEINKLKMNSKVSLLEPWLDNVRREKPHQLTAEIERILHEKTVTGRNAWSRLFDETMASMKFKLDGAELTNSEIMSRMSDPNNGVRKKAAKAFSRELEANVSVISLVTNTLAKDKEVEDGWRNFKRPISNRNLSNQIEDEVVDSLVQTVKNNYRNLSHRYYLLKAHWLGVERLNYWDRNAPLPNDNNKKISWEAAKKIVLSSYSNFDTNLGDIGKQFFDNGWIDAEPRVGKDPGAFSHPTVPSVNPYILMNFHGKTRDVMTLAHEVGHGIHQVLAAPQGHFLSDTPLTLAETASVFGEMLTFKGMLDAASDQEHRKVMLGSKVEDMLNTVVRQIAFYSFEEAVHSERARGEISSDRLGEIWMAIQQESLGPAFQFDDDYKFFWSYIPHFIHSPFYVYAYAFGDCLVNSLYSVFETGQPEFKEKYINMLKAGGTLRHKELLKPFGLDANDPHFWQRGLNVVSGFIDDLEKAF
ncbi:MAG: oligoendopeptidase F [Rhodospirillaceae bacterium]|nr:oligoendopeptidase F [Rhodospirillaceae bacterium]OUT78241.1 MAG: oligoendopeptidase F [Rhodospirillaceae bacterium TMED23]|tara:strand:- start:4590 stop:6368 length:1779 start_codon:yes stop_codon:yes gene_type:complete